jgi:hypothetical protein
MDFLYKSKLALINRMELEDGVSSLEDKKQS